MIEKKVKLKKEAQAKCKDNFPGLVNKSDKTTEERRELEKTVPNKSNSYSSV